MEEAKLHGYATVQDWYLDCRADGAKASEAEIRSHKLEYANLENRWKASQAEADEDAGEDVHNLRESQSLHRLCGSRARKLGVG